MSGQLVGEVIAASDMLRARGLSERGFHALLAIAEKANTESRRASVPLRHICRVLYGDMESKQRTAERAIHDLKTTGVIRVVKRGFNNGHGRAAAPIYEIADLSDTDTGDGNGPESDTDTGDGNAPTVPDKPGTVSDKMATVPDTAMSDLTFIINGFTNVNGHLSNADDASAHGQDGFDHGPLDEPPDDDAAPERTRYPGIAMTEDWMPSKRAYDQMLKETGRPREWLDYWVESLREDRLVDGRLSDGRSEGWDDEWRSRVRWANAKEEPPADVLERRRQGPSRSSGLGGQNTDNVASLFRNLFAHQRAADTNVIDGEVIEG